MLYVVGIGPGNEMNMTKSCRDTLVNADVIVGYSKYIELVLPFVPQKPVIQTGMTQEICRAETALSLAAEGKNIALVCGGDAGVYAMAGIVYEMSEHYPNVQIEIIPGITAALSGSALLGASIGHDFCVISLSDLLTPRELIEKRIDCAATGDFCIVFYNPASKKRADYLKRACDIILKRQAANVICGVAANIGREKQRSQVMTLAQLREYKADMFTTVFVGNSQTKIIGGKMVTPRGYGIG